MGGVYLTDLADVLRRAGLEVIEYDGWKTRARGSGGYEPGRPTALMIHHTASPPSWSGQRDADYCAIQDSDAPLSNLCLDRSGAWWVLAAGATNCNGKGSDWWGGGVPPDSMNSYALACEANGGYGGEWPKVQQDAYVTGATALVAAYGISNNCVRGHFEWAPDRKVDPAGPSKWSSSSASWDMDGFRADCLTGDTDAIPRPMPQPRYELAAIHDEEDPMFIGSKDGVYWIGNGLGRRQVSDDDLDDVIEMFARSAPLVGFNNGKFITTRAQVPSGRQMDLMGVNVS